MGRGRGGAWNTVKVRWGSINCTCIGFKLGMGYQTRKEDTEEGGGLHFVLETFILVTASGPVTTDVLGQGAGVGMFRTGANKEGCIGIT